MCPLCASPAHLAHRYYCPNAAVAPSWPDSWLTPTEAKAARNAA